MNPWWIIQTVLPEALSSVFRTHIECPTVNGLATTCNSSSNALFWHPLIPVLTYTYIWRQNASINAWMWTGSSKNSWCVIGMHRICVCGGGGGRHKTGTGNWLRNHRNTYVLERILLAHIFEENKNSKSHSSRLSIECREVFVFSHCSLALVCMHK